MRPVVERLAIYAVFKRRTRRQNKYFQCPFQIERLTTQPLRLIAFQAASAAAKPLLAWALSPVKSDRTLHCKQLQLSLQPKTSLNDAFKLLGRCEHCGTAKRTDEARNILAM